MSLVSLSLPLRNVVRIVHAVERIANALDRAYPLPFTKDDKRLRPPEPGAFVVTDDVIVEEQTREALRLQGYRPDDIDAMMEEVKDAANQTTPQ